MKQVLSIADQFGALLQASRKSAGLSQTELARHLGLSQSRLSALELNASSIRLDQLLTMCSALDLELLVQTKGTGLEGPHCILRVRMHAQHDYRQFRFQLTDLSQHIHAVPARQRYVQQYQGIIASR